MSNHTPQVETNLTVTRSLAVTVLVSLLALAILLIVAATHLFVHGKEHGDLLYTLAGFISVGLAIFPAYFLFDILYDIASDKK